MIGPNFQPIGTATLHWLPPSQGGRRAVPRGPFYAATARFDPHILDEDLSIVLKYLRSSVAFGEGFDAEFGFLMPELIVGRLKSGLRFTVKEGPRMVAEGVVKEVRM